MYIFHAVNHFFAIFKASANIIIPFWRGVEPSTAHIVPDEAIPHHDSLIFSVFFFIPFFVHPNNLLALTVAMVLDRHLH